MTGAVQKILRFALPLGRYSAHKPRATGTRAPAQDDKSAQDDMVGQRIFRISSSRFSKRMKCPSVPGSVTFDPDI